MKRVSPDILAAGCTLVISLVLVLACWAAHVPAARLTTPVAAGVARLGGMQTSHEGQRLKVMKSEWNFTRTYTLTEAGAGMRPLAWYVIVAAVVASLPRREWWQRAVIVLAGAPVGIVLIGTRIGLLIIDDADGVTRFPFLQPDGPDVMLVPGTLVFLLIGWLLGKFLVEDAPTPAP